MSLHGTTEKRSDPQVITKHVLSEINSNTVPLYPRIRSSRCIHALRRRGGVRVLSLEI